MDIKITRHLFYLPHFKRKLKYLNFLFNDTDNVLLIQNIIPSNKICFRTFFFNFNYLLKFFHPKMMQCLLLAVA